MSQQPTPDEWTEGAESFVYRDGNWTTPTGYCVSTAQGHELTIKFYQHHGRSPHCPEPPKAPVVRRRSRVVAERAPAAPRSPREVAVKAAVVRALAARGASAPAPRAVAATRRRVAPAKASKASKPSKATSRTAR